MLLLLLGLFIKMNLLYFDAGCSLFYDCFTNRSYNDVNMDSVVLSFSGDESSYVRIYLIYNIKIQSISSNLFNLLIKHRIF